MIALGLIFNLIGSILLTIAAATVKHDEATRSLQVSATKKSWYWLGFAFLSFGFIIQLVGVIIK